MVFVSVPPILEAKTVEKTVKYKRISVKGCRTFHNKPIEAPA
tara:strand:- start:522 stop:647 length:126 start_codon:yes stop_codon:yes gene_type:complete